MRLPRRGIIGAALAASVRPLAAQPVPEIRVGVLRFGTVSWELDTIAHHGFDHEAGVTIHSVEFATPQASLVALQAGAVDTVVSDWLFAARQRAMGTDTAFLPFSNAAGAVVLPAGSPIADVPGLVGRTLGIAGSPLDKSWLILRAYATKRFGIDLDRQVTKVFGPPPLLAEQMKAGRLDALLTFWPFAARAEASGARQLLLVEDAVAGLGSKAGVPFTGYVFSAEWASSHSATLKNFVAASQAARKLLKKSDEAWKRIAPLTDAKSDEELARLRDWYRRGVPEHWGATERDAASKLFDIMAAIGGEALVGPARHLPDGTFWPIDW